MGKINLKNFFSDKPDIKYKCAKRAIALSRSRPKELYPDFDFFLKFLDGENKILKWTAIQVIGNLSKVDSQNKADIVLPVIIDALFDKSMITAANAIGALSEIAANKPQHQETILESLLKVEKAVYYSKGRVSPECRNVAIGKVLDSLEKFGPAVFGRYEIQNFLKRQTKNTRPKVKLAAEKLLKKYACEMINDK